MALFKTHCSLDTFRSHWELEQSGTAGIENRVGDHSPHADDGGFPASLRWRILGIDQNGLYLGQPGETRYLVRVKIEVEDLSSFKMDLFSQSITQPHGDTALHLAFGTFRIDR